MPDVIKKKLRTIDCTAVAVLVLVVALVIAMGILPLSHQSQLNVARGETLTKQLADFQSLDKTLDRARVDLKETQKRLDEAESRLPSQGEMAQFMQELAHVADTAGLQVDSITPHALQDVGNYKAMPVEILGSGDFNTCYKFLHGLRHMNRLTRLDDLVLQSIEPDKNSPKVTDRMCTIRVTISTFMVR